MLKTSDGNRLCCLCLMCPEFYQPELGVCVKSERESGACQCGA